MMCTSSFGKALHVERDDPEAAGSDFAFSRRTGTAGRYTSGAEQSELPAPYITDRVNGTAAGPS
jgi:hypothetical protein